MGDGRRRIGTGGHGLTTNDPLREAVLQHKILKKNVLTEEKTRAAEEARVRAEERARQSEVNLAMQFWAAIQNGMSAGEIRANYLRTQDWGAWKRFSRHFPDAGTKKPKRVTYSREGDTVLWFRDADDNELSEAVRIDMSTGTPIPDISRGREFYDEYFGSVSRLVALVRAEVGDE